MSTPLCNIPSFHRSEGRCNYFSKQKAESNYNTTVLPTQYYKRPFRAKKSTFTSRNNIVIILTAMKDEMNEIDQEVDIELTGEDNVDEPLIEEAEENSNQKIKKLQAKLKECEAAKTEHLDNLQRAKAEFLNVRKRLEEEKVRESERTINKHIEKLLPLCDSFHMAMSNTAAWEKVDAEWRTGVESINNQLQRIIESYGVSAIDPEGQTFDPNVHEAMTEVPVDDESKDHTVVSVIQNGYIRKSNDREELIRPARVAVGIFESK